SCNCQGTCESPCEAYEDIKEIYLNKESAEIILQPFGVLNKITNNSYRIQYNLLEQEFIVSEGYEYNENEKRFISKHIIRFNLNDSEYRTKEVMKVCEDVTDYRCIPRKDRYNNLVAGLFIDRLNSIETEKAIKLCEQIIIYSSMKLTV
ncbi:MAG: hypothetical protein ACRCXA_01490, partial [Peptostreptococcaceae bacterium]